MPLRNVNEPFTAAQILQEVATVATPNTALLAANGAVLINTREPLYQAQATWPALILWEGPQSSARIYWYLWQPKLTAICVYMNRWDQNNTLIDTLWSAIDTDLRRMKSNLEDNPRIYVSGTAYAADITLVTLSPFAGNVNRTDYVFPVVERQMIVQINLAPYTSRG
jgi:hypothetical protein